ncbi:taurine catabolism dioxygenase, putative [Ichthyophthirius multifiliis]|uniref:Taurine catabolism dioxygenase, putative n=1 Tax=Ichthyophthirius multifiliis TaxID=5932 RepID=G0QJ16_ICHMU|nr:taurine catabolism dioxygenase, putative [Ichthyophthirius multifiliis]EGR34781.1 taurine catabolism dioxygenase, putative [Ichthyophthirius multifiliis]|eukprot:XP_004040085.1 taurine catabolism dioxygenase, putative [Ichthyophthirius multifiliis]
MATSIPHIHSFVKDLKNRFGLQNDNKIFIAIEQELLKNDIVLLKSILNQYEIQFIFPSDIYAIQNEGNVQLFDKKTNNQIQKIILELHQTEIMSLDQNVLIGLLQLSDQGLCLNDLRAILILHDKRLLTVLSGFYSCQLLEEIIICNKKHSFRDSSYFSTGIVQPFLKSIQFQAPIYNENKEWQFENCNIVSTLLCMDGIFYGPGIFRCSQSDIIALSKGGFCQPAALLLTQVPSKARFILTTRLLDDSENNYKEEKEVLGSQINAAFDEHSAVLTTILSEKQGEEDENWNSDRLKQYVCEIIKGKPQDHLDCLLKNEQDQSLKQQQELQIEQRAFATFISEQEKNQQILKNKPKIVWDIKPQSLTTKSNDGSSNNTYARSHGTGRFDTHTDGSWYEKPPRALALSVLNCDRRGGGFFSIVKVSECIKQLSEDEQLEFKQKKYLYKVPPEFSGGQNSQYKILPVQFDQDKIRFRYDLMQPLRDEKQCPLLEKFKNISKKLIKQKMCLIPEKYCIIADNQRILHARTLIKDERRFLQRIRFFL